jgi:hypothetical protein
MVDIPVLEAGAFGREGYAWRSTGSYLRVDDLIAQPGVEIIPVWMNTVSSSPVPWPDIFLPGSRRWDVVIEHNSQVRYADVVER